MLNYKKGGVSMSKNIYVLSDLHGHFDIFIQMLKKINFNDNDELYILGDCCDRGPDSLKIYMYIAVSYTHLLQLEKIVKLKLRKTIK